jgi:hypothetical protein
MSTDSNVQTEVKQVNQIVEDTQVTQTKVIDEDDNKLVTQEDLDKQDDADVKPSLWSDSDRLAKLRAEMQVLSKVRIPVEQIPEVVILKAMAEVLAELDWTDYGSFNKMIRCILTGPPKSVPFAVKTRNTRTGKMDFWLILVFIPISGPNSDYEFDSKKYNKRDVLMSHQFCDYLRDFCRTQLKDEAQFWTFTGSYRNKQHLDMTKLNKDDMAALRQMGETNPSNLVMFQFKKKVPEVYVGGKKASGSGV